MIKIASGIFVVGVIIIIGVDASISRFFGLTNYNLSMYLKLLIIPIVLLTLDFGLRKLYMKFKK